MRVMIISVAAAAFGAVVATGAANAANPNVPTYSPYALMNVESSVPDLARTSKPLATDQQIEGRSAYERPVFPLSLLPFYWFQ